LARSWGWPGSSPFWSFTFSSSTAGLTIAANASDSYGRLLAGGLSLVFFVYVFVNTGMVTGLLPVVGVPLPLVSYGGTSMVTLMAGFGMLMAVQTHRKTLQF
jgi:rod shape determining protein RodA